MLQNNEEIKKRYKNLFFVSAIILFCLILYYFLYVNYPDFVLKCFFYELTGFKCPGCGITRMLSSFINFDFVNGSRKNLFLAITLPYVIFIIIYNIHLYLKNKKSNKYINVSCYVYVVLLLIWGIVRNIVKL